MTTLVLEVLPAKAPDYYLLKQVIEFDINSWVYNDRYFPPIVIETVLFAKKYRLLLLQDSSEFNQRHGTRTFLWEPSFMAALKVRRFWFCYLNPYRLSDLSSFHPKEIQNKIVHIILIYFFQINLVQKIHVFMKEVVSMLGAISSVPASQGIMGRHASKKVRKPLRRLDDPSSFS